MNENKPNISKEIIEKLCLGMLEPQFEKNLSLLQVFAPIIREQLKRLTHEDVALGITLAAYQEGIPLREAIERQEDILKRVAAGDYSMIGQRGNGQPGSSD